MLETVTYARCGQPMKRGEYRRLKAGEGAAFDDGLGHWSMAHRSRKRRGGKTWQEIIAAKASKVGG